MLGQHDVDTLRRRLVGGETLSVWDLQALIDACDRLLTERVQIERVLLELQPRWNRSRVALNALHRIVHRDAPADRPPT